MRLAHYQKKIKIKKTWTLDSHHLINKERWIGRVKDIILGEYIFRRMKGMWFYVFRGDFSTDFRHKIKKKKKKN
jgi:hypothetical protein